MWIMERVQRLPKIMGFNHSWTRTTGTIVPRSTSKDEDLRLFSDERQDGDDTVENIFC